MITQIKHNIVQNAYVPEIGLIIVSHEVVEIKINSFKINITHRSLLKTILVSCLVLHCISLGHSVIFIY